MIKIKYNEETNSLHLRTNCKPGTNMVDALAVCFGGVLLGCDRKTGDHSFSDAVIRKLMLVFSEEGLKHAER